MDRSTKATLSTYNTWIQLSLALKSFAIRLESLWNVYGVSMESLGIFDGISMDFQVNPQSR